MTIYISHSKNFEYQTELYQVLQNSSLAHKHELILPHLNSSSSYPTKDLLLNKKCDLIIAEVSYPATGQGIELGWADIAQVPILCIYKKDHKIAGSLKLLTNSFFDYEDLSDILIKLETKIEDFIVAKKA